MLQRKKLEFYAKQVGIEDLSKVKLTEEDCERICKAVNTKVYHARDISFSIAVLIECVMDDPDFIKAHRSEGGDNEIFLIRCGDYAAREVFAAYVKN